jgi:hypothetical protein
MKQEMEIDCSNTPFFRSRMKYPGLPLLVPGCYKFQIAFKSAKGKKWSRVATLPLFVEFAPPAESTESQEGAKALPASHD